LSFDSKKTFSKKIKKLLANRKKLLTFASPSGTMTERVIEEETRVG